MAGSASPQHDGRCSALMALEMAAINSGVSSISTARRPTGDELAEFGDGQIDAG